MPDTNEQWLCIQFSFKLDKNAADIHRMLQVAFGDQVLSRLRMTESFKYFKEGHESFGNLHRLSTYVKFYSNTDYRLSMTFAKSQNHRVEYTNEWMLFHEPNLRRIAAKFVPRFLNTISETAGLKFVQSFVEQLQAILTS